MDFSEAQRDDSPPGADNQYIWEIARDFQLFVQAPLSYFTTHTYSGLFHLELDERKCSRFSC